MRRRRRIRKNVLFLDQKMFFLDKRPCNGRLVFREVGAFASGSVGAYRPLSKHQGDRSRWESRGYPAWAGFRKLNLHLLRLSASGGLSRVRRPRLLLCHMTLIDFLYNIWHMAQNRSRHMASFYCHMSLSISGTCVNRGGQTGRNS